MTGTGNDGDGSQAGRFFGFVSGQLRWSEGGGRRRWTDVLFSFFFRLRWAGEEGKVLYIIIASALDGSSCNCTCMYLLRLSGRE